MLKYAFIFIIVTTSCTTKIQTNLVKESSIPHTTKILYDLKDPRFKNWTKTSHYQDNLAERKVFEHILGEAHLECYVGYSGTINMQPQYIDYSDTDNINVSGNLNLGSVRKDSYSSIYEYHCEKSQQLKKEVISWHFTYWVQSFSLYVEEPTTKNESINLNKTYQKYRDKIIQLRKYALKGSNKDPMAYFLKAPEINITPILRKPYASTNILYIKDPQTLELRRYINEGHINFCDAWDKNMNNWTAADMDPNIKEMLLYQKKTNIKDEFGNYLYTHNGSIAYGKNCQSLTTTNEDSTPIRETFGVATKEGKQISFYQITRITLNEDAT